FLREFWRKRGSFFVDRQGLASFIDAIAENVVWKFERPNAIWSDFLRSRASKIRQTFVRQILAAEFPVPSDKTIMRFAIHRPAASWSPRHQSRALAGVCRAPMCRHLVMHLSHCRMSAFDPKRTSRDRSGHPVVPLIWYPCAVECTRDFLSPMWIANFELFQIVAFGLLQLTHLVGTSPRVIRLAERDVADNLCLQSRTPVWPHL